MNAPFGLTPELLRVFRFIDQYIAANDHSPSFDEIAVGMGMSSKAGVHRRLISLRDRGYIDWVPKAGRSIRILRRTESGLSFLPEDLRKAIEEHCAQTGEKPFDVLCDAIKLHLDECELLPAETAE